MNFFRSSSPIQPIVKHASHRLAGRCGGNMCSACRSRFDISDILHDELLANRAQLPRIQLMQRSQLMQVLMSRKGLWLIWLERSCCSGGRNTFSTNGVLNRFPPMCSMSKVIPSSWRKCHWRWVPCWRNDPSEKANHERACPYLCQGRR